MADRETKTYNVGYRKPPVETRFKKGKSGNPKGRPKGSKSFLTLIIEELRQKIVVTENGRPTRITKSKALVKKLYNKAMNGEASDMKLFLSVLTQIGHFRSEAEEIDEGPIQIIAELPWHPPWERNRENWNDRKIRTFENGVVVDEKFIKKDPSEGPFIVDPNGNWTTTEPGQEKDAWGNRTVRSTDEQK